MINNFKKVPLFIGTLSALSLLSVGFSSWIITGATTSSDISNITFSSEEVIDQRMSLSISDLDDSISFDCKKDDITPPIAFTGTGNGEDLQFGFKLKLTNAFLNVAENNFVRNNWFNGLTFKMEVNDSTKTDTNVGLYQDAINKHYFVQPLNEVLQIDTFAKSHLIGSGYYSYTCKNNNHDLDLDIKFTFKWGEAFNNSNPGLFSKDNCWTGTNALKTTDDVVNALKDLYEINSKVTFKVIIGFIPLN